MVDPYRQTNIAENTFIREFSASVLNEELVWHRDRKDRTVKVLQGENWELQMDNELPVIMEIGESYYIPAYKYHRIKRGKDTLVVEINEKP